MTTPHKAADITRQANAMKAAIVAIHTKLVSKAEVKAPPYHATLAGNEYLKHILNQQMRIDSINRESATEHARFVQTCGQLDATLCGDLGAAYTAFIPADRVPRKVVASKGKPTTPSKNKAAGPPLSDDKPAVKKPKTEKGGKKDDPPIKKEDEAETAQPSVTELSASEKGAVQRFLNLCKLVEEQGEEKKAAFKRALDERTAALGFKDFQILWGPSFGNEVESDGPVENGGGEGGVPPTDEGETKPVEERAMVLFGR